MQRARAAVLRGVVVLALVAVGVAGAGCMDLGDTGDGSTPTAEPTLTEDGPGNGQPSEPDGSADPSFALSILDVTDSTVAGDTVTVAVEVTNVGDASGTQTISLGNATESVALDSNASTTIELNWSATDPGTQELTVTSANDTATATVEVLEAVPEFEVSIAETNDPVEDRDPLAVTAEVTNAGTVEATQTVNLTAAGEVVDSTNVTLERGESATTNLTWQIATPYDDHTVEIASANDTAATTVTVEPVEAPAVAGEVSVMTDGITAEGGAVHLYKQGEDDAVASEDLAPNGTFRFTDLDPGTTYELEIRSAVATHPDTGKRIGGIRNFPKTEYTFTAESIQQSADLVYGYEIRGAKTYRWEYFKDLVIVNRLVGYGRYNQSEAYVVERHGAGKGDPIITQMVYLENKTFMKSTNTNAPVWYENPEYNYEPPTTIPHRIVQDPIQEFIHLTRQFEGETVVNGTTVHKYSLSGLRDYPEATVYIDPDTGYIIKWESEHYYRVGSEGRYYDYPAEIWFSDHNTNSIIIESPR